MTIFQLARLAYYGVALILAVTGIWNTVAIHAPRGPLGKLRERGSVVERVRDRIRDRRMRDDGTLEPDPLQQIDIYRRHLSQAWDLGQLQQARIERLEADVEQLQHIAIEHGVDPKALHKSPDESEPRTTGH